MEKYKNRSKNSGVMLYEISTDYIKIRFKHTPEIYTYNYEIPGKRIVEQMKVLAKDGKGLSTFIAQEVRDNYFRKA